MDTPSRIAAVAEAADLGEPSARKTGRDPRWPYVPVVQEPADASGYRKWTQLRGLAFATRTEAVDRAQAHIDAARRQLAEHLAEARYRALREQHGLPRELADV